MLSREKHYFNHLPVRLTDKNQEREDSFILKLKEKSWFFSTEYSAPSLLRCFKEEGSLWGVVLLSGDWAGMVKVGAGGCRGQSKYLLYMHSHAHTSFTNMKLSRKPSMSWDADNHTKPDSKYIQMNNKWAVEKAVCVYAAKEWLLWVSLGKKSISQVIVHDLGLQTVLQGLDKERKGCISSSWKKKIHKYIGRELTILVKQNWDHFQQVLKGNSQLSVFRPKSVCPEWYRRYFNSPLLWLVRAVLDCSQKGPTSYFSAWSLSSNTEGQRGRAPGGGVGRRLVACGDRVGLGRVNLASATRPVFLLETAALRKPSFGFSTLIIQS